MLQSVHEMQPMMYVKSHLAAVGGGPLRRRSESYRARSPLSVSVRYARLMSADRAASPCRCILRFSV
jgi:hypothetical protein